MKTTGFSIGQLMESADVSVATTFDHIITLTLILILICNPNPNLVAVHFGYKLLNINPLCYAFIQKKIRTAIYL